MANTGFPAVVGLTDGHQMALTHDNIFLPKSIPPPTMPSAGNLINLEPYDKPPQRAANQHTPYMPSFQMEQPRLGKRFFPKREALIRQEQGVNPFIPHNADVQINDDPRRTERGEARYREYKERSAAARNFQTARVTNQMDFPWREYEPANRENLKRRFPEKRRAANA